MQHQGEERRVLNAAVEERTDEVFGSGESNRFAHDLPSLIDVSLLKEREGKKDACAQIRFKIETVRELLEELLQNVGGCRGLFLF